LRLSAARHIKIREKESTIVSLKRINCPTLK